MKIEKTKIMQKLNKIKWTLYSTPLLVALFNAKVYAESSISSAEVTTATDNLKNAVIKLAIPIRKCISIC